MSHTPTHRPSIGQAAHGRHEIKALKDVGRTPGGIQYRTQTGAQAELTLPTATDFLLGNDGVRPTWVSATQVATATQPALSYLYSVTASASQILVSWASVATIYSKFEIDFSSFMGATRTAFAVRFSTDGVTINTATNASAYQVVVGHSSKGNATVYDSGAATNSASQAVLTAGATGYLLATDDGLYGRMFIWPSSMSGAVKPKFITEMSYIGDLPAGGDRGLINLRGVGMYWPAADINGISIYCVPGSASFIDGVARVYGHV